MNFRSWQRWQLIEYALLQKISEEKAVENGKALPQTKQEDEKTSYYRIPLLHSVIHQHAMTDMLIHKNILHPSIMI